MAVWVINLMEIKNLVRFIFGSSFFSRFSLVFFLRDGDGANNNLVTRRRSSSLTQSIKSMILPQCWQYFFPDHFESFHRFVKESDGKISHASLFKLLEAIKFTINIAKITS